MIRILLVDDSLTAQRLMLRALSGQPDLEVVGMAATGVEAVAMAERLRPTLVTMDIRMPDMDGLAATERIMEECPTRIVIVSAEVGLPDQRLTFDALQAGALEVLSKPKLQEGVSFDRYRTELLSTVRAMAGVSVLRRRRGNSGFHLRPQVPAPVATAPPGRRYRLVALGASTGGPQVIARIVSGLPKDFSVPLVVVQHMSHGFTEGFAGWLAGESKVRVKLAEHGETPVPGCVYIAPERQHLKIANDFRMQLSAADDVQLFCPSVDVLFESLATSVGRQAIAILLTGMGTDGAQGMLAMRKAGAWTLAQAGDSCVVNGMPQAAANLGGVDNFVSPALIASLLVEATELPH